MLSHHLGDTAHLAVSAMQRVSSAAACSLACTTLSTERWCKRRRAQPQRAHPRLGRLHIKTPPQGELNVPVHRREFPGKCHNLCTTRLPRSRMSPSGADMAAT